MAAPKYRIQIWDMSGAAFAPGVLIAELDDAVNLGWGQYLNDVPEAFFTLSQDDSKVTLLRAYRFNAHVKIYRDADLVWGGFLGEYESNERDVIVYCYGYLAFLYVLLTTWNNAYTSAQVNTIVSDAWTRAKTTLASSLVGWITTGTIETPVTTSGGGVAIVIPSYRLFYKRILQLLNEMAVLSIGDTTNTVVYEITPSGTFNFWKNRGVDTSLTWKYGGREIRRFFEGNAPIFRRNDIFAVGNNPNDATLKQEVADATDISAKGLRMEPVFFSWVRDSTELDRVVKARAKRALRDDIDIQVEHYANALIPPGATGAQFKLSDRITIKIARGLTNIDGLYMAVGVQALYIRGKERVRVLLQQRTGS